MCTAYGSLRVSCYILKIKTSSQLNFSALIGAFNRVIASSKYFADSSTISLVILSRKAISVLSRLLVLNNVG